LSTHLIIPDPHAHYQHNNTRAEWAGRLINDVKPDTVVVLGDTADMPSLSSYDKGRKVFQGRSYAADVASHGDFQERLWDTVRKAKRKLPRRVTLIGNHEQRIERALDIQPELEGTISYNDLQLERYYDEVVYYNGRSPGSIEIDGVHYSHFMVSGVMGQPIGGEHQAYSLLSKHHASCTVGHSHTYDACVRTTASGRKIYGLVAGCYIDYDSDWAGQSKRLWWSGVFVKRGVTNGQYDLEAISIDRLKREYGR
jgi:hypothetical protein